MASKLRVQVDTQQAQNGVGNFSNKWTELASKMTVLGAVFNKTMQLIDGLNDKVKESADLYSQFAKGGDAAELTLHNLMSATDGMIKAQTLMRSANQLVFSDLKLTQNQMEAVAKAAVEMGRANNESGDIVLNKLSKAISKGAVSPLAEYGIQLEKTGTLQEKQKRAIDALVKGYGNLKIAVGDANEAHTKYTNEGNLQLLEMAHKADGLSQKWTQMKTNFKENFLVGLDVLLDSSNSKMFSLDEKLKNISKATGKSQKEVITLRQINIELLKQKNKLQEDYKLSKDVNILQKMADIDKDILINNQKRTLELGKTVQLTGILAKRGRMRVRLVKQYRSELELVNDKLETQKDLAWAIQSAQEDTWGTGTVIKPLKTIKSKVKLGPSKEELLQQQLEAEIEAEKQRKELLEKRWNAELEIYQNEQNLITERENRIKNLSKLRLKSLDEIREKRKQLAKDLTVEGILESEKVVIFQEKVVKVLNEIAKRTESMPEPRGVLGIQYREKTIELDKAIRNNDLERIKLIKEELILLKQKNQTNLQDTELAKRKIALTTDLNTKSILQNQIAIKTIEMQRLKKQGDLEGVSAIRTQILAMQAQSEKLTQLQIQYPQTMAIVNEVGAVMKQVAQAGIQAMMIETSELRKQGKTRKQVLLETLKASMKTLAIQYGVKSITTFGEALFASIFAPAAAPVLYAAAGKYALGATIAGSIAGSIPKTSSKGGGGSSSSGRSVSPPVTGNQQTQTNQISLYFTDSVVATGGIQKVAGELVNAINDNQEKGTISNFTQFN